MQSRFSNVSVFIKILHLYRIVINKVYLSIYVFFWGGGGGVANVSVYVYMFALCPCLAQVLVVWDSGINKARNYRLFEEVSSYFAQILNLQYRSFYQGNICSY